MKSILLILSSFYAEKPFGVLMEYQFFFLIAERKSVYHGDLICRIVPRAIAAEQYLFRALLSYDLQQDIVLDERIA